MKWPFTKNEKTALKETTRLDLITPPRPRSTGRIVPDDLKKTQTIYTNTPLPAVTLDTAECIPLRFQSVLSQVAPQLFIHDAQESVADLTLQVPARLVIPQLSTGKITIAWADLIPLIPTDYLKHPAPANIEQGPVTLPMNEVVAAIPPEAFPLQNEPAADLKSSEFEDLPDLFDESTITPIPATPTPAIQPTATTETTTPVETATEPAGTPAPALSLEISPVHKPWGDAESIFIGLRSLVAGMPDNVFSCPRSELWQHADPNTQIPLPVAPLVNQLGTARLTVPLATVIQAMPPQIIVSPLPDIQNEVIPLPLHEVIRQIPPSLFSLQVKAQQQAAAEVSDADIPTPFAEKTEASTTPTPQPATTPLPLAARKPEPTELDLTNDNYAVFAEKPEHATTTPQPVIAEITPTPEPRIVEKEPVVEQAPVATPEITPQPTTPVAPPLGRGSEFLTNLNRCTFDELQRLDGVGPILAKRIVDYRTEHGDFRSVRELRKVPGIGRKTFAVLAGVPLRRLNRLLGVTHDNELALPEILQLIAVLPGVDGCVLAAEDGLPLTAHLPEGFDQERISVFAPELFKKAAPYASELGVGSVRRLTLFTETHAVSILKAGTIFLVVVHHPDRFSKALLRRCANISEELATLCRQPAAL